MDEKRKKLMQDMATERVAFYKVDGNRPEVELAICDAYIQGWKDADANPAWISTKDELPPKEECEMCMFEYSIDVFVTDGAVRCVGYYDYRFKRWMGDIDDPTHWMYMPELPKCEEEEK